MEGGLDNPAIVVAAWNRPLPLQRLLHTVARGEFTQRTTLHISIDHSGRDDVRRLAEAFQWPHGDKVVEAHTRRLGLRAHMLHCGGLSARYGAVVLLEDDLAVSPWMHAYACQALRFYAADDRVAGVSLYKYAVAESCLQPFEPWQDGSDSWFLQVPSSWGAAYSAAQWQAFTDWLAQAGGTMPQLPRYMAPWGQQSWKRLMAGYLIARQRYMAYPQQSLSTNFEDPGTHANTKGLFQVPLCMGRRDWRLARLDDSRSVYDAHFEPLPAQLRLLCPSLDGLVFTVDLLGQKEGAFIDQPLVLTRRKGGEALQSWPADALPLELNLMLPTPGDALRLVRSDAPLVPPDDLNLQFRHYTGAAKASLLQMPERLMPAITVILPGDLPDPDGSVLSSLLDGQAYAGTELVALVKAGQVGDAIWEAHVAGRIRLKEVGQADLAAIDQAVREASGHLILVLAEPMALATDVLARIARIFQQFAGLRWLSGVPFNDAGLKESVLMAHYRWDSDRFAEANPEQIRHYLPASMQVFRRSLWIEAGPPQGDLQARFRAMAGRCLPTVAMLEMGAWPMPALPSTWGSQGSNPSRAHYHRHIPLLWKRHRRRSDYLPVLRYDAQHDTWYEFAY